MSMLKRLYLLATPPRRRLATLCLAVAAATATAAAAATAAATAAPAAPAPAPLVFAPYAFETKAHGTIAAEAAYLDVPARHAAPDGARLRLRVVRLRATGGDGRAAPVVYLAGGPGGSGIGTARGPRWPVFDQVRQQADVLLLDQRGAGQSDPPPACPHAHRFAAGQPIERTAALAALRDVAARCVAFWTQQKVDLGAYTTAESAGDLDHLRRALGVPRISLWGMSYGTHLALATLRLHGDGVERVVLMGVEGPDDTLKLPLSADALLAQLDTLARPAGFADLTGSATRVLAALREQPRHASSVLQPGTQVTLGAYDLQLAMAAMLGRRTTQQWLPFALHEAERGEYGPLADIVLLLRGEFGEFSAMSLAMDIASGQSPHRRALVDAQARASLFGDALNFPFPALGDGLGLADLGEDFRGALRSDVPTLFISGTLDGRTPPANAEALRPGFAHGVSLQVRGASHDNEMWLGDPAIAAAISGFLAGKTISDATLTLPPPEFVTSREAMLRSLPR